MAPIRSSAQRRSTYLHRCDRALLFALFYDDFIAWGYPVPRLFQFRSLRLLTVCACALIPMKSELINAKTVMALQALPALRSGKVIFGLTAPLHLAVRRARMMVLQLSEGFRRITGHIRTLPPLQVASEAPELEPAPPSQFSDDLRPARPRPV